METRAREPRAPYCSVPAIQELLPEIIKASYRTLMSASVEIHAEKYVLDTVTGEKRGLDAAA